MKRTLGHKKHVAESRRTFLVRAVLLGVMLARLGAVMRGMVSMALRGMGVMSSLLVMTAFMMLCSFAVVLGGLLVMLGGLMVMFRSLMRHGFSPLCSAHTRSMRLLAGKA
jgi:hypothetical protein